MPLPLFIHEVEVVQPLSGDLPPVPVLLPKGGYWEAMCPLATLLHEDFLKRLVRPANVSFLAVSIGRQLDRETCFAVTSDGTLTVSMHKDIYERAGLTGRSVQETRDIVRYVVEVDLRAESFVPGKKLHDRVTHSLATHFTEPVRFFFTFDEAAAKNDAVVWLKAQPWIKKRIEEIVPREHVFKNIAIPDLATLAQSKDSLDDIYEWLGLVACGALGPVAEGSLQEFVSSYRTPEPNMPGSLVVHRWTGLIAPSTLSKLLTTAAGSQWLAVTSWGFQDSPVAKSHHDHVFLTRGDNHSTSLLLDTGANITFSSSSNTTEIQRKPSLQSLQNRKRKHRSMNDD